MTRYPEKRGARPEKPSDPPKVVAPLPLGRGQGSDRIRLQITEWEDGNPVIEVEVGKLLKGRFIVSESEEARANE